jgi:hypothetical protein
MKESDAVRDGLRMFYERFSAGDPSGFADAIATGPGVSVIGSAPGEGHDDRDSWVATYAELIPKVQIKLQGGPSPRGFQEGSVGYATDEPRFVLPDGSYLPTRLTGVLHLEDDAWKIVHLHFSVGVPDEEAVQPG